LQKAVLKPAATTNEVNHGEIIMKATIITLLVTLALVGTTQARHSCQLDQCEMHRLEREIRNADQVLCNARRQTPRLLQAEQVEHHRLRQAQQQANGIRNDHSSVQSRLAANERQLRSLRSEICRVEDFIRNLKARLCEARTQAPSRYNHGCRPSSNSHAVIEQRLIRACSSLTRLKADQCRIQAEQAPLQHRCRDLASRLAPAEAVLNRVERTHRCAADALAGNRREVRDQERLVNSLRHQLASARCGAGAVQPERGHEGHDHAQRPARPHHEYGHGERHEQTRQPQHPAPTRTHRQHQSVSTFLQLLELLAQR